MKTEQELLDEAITECPACGETADKKAIVLAGEGYCRNDECPVMGYDPWQEEPGTEGP